MLRDGKESASNMCKVNASFVVGSCNFLFILKHVFDTKKNVLCKKVQEGARRKDAFGRKAISVCLKV